MVSQVLQYFEPLKCDKSPKSQAVLQTCDGYIRAD